ncbi:MAG: hypothetical protein A3G27_17950 [Betaproteobacteria bacterium RIFCSPLOWO2_12_FULL_66_14]|nr:MAG: hypothetical protein A3G27_17950 [Betaproteobacteria bacterium RIFCSPLOWO2_12_FULL_66_14]
MTAKATNGLPRADHAMAPLLRAALESTAEGVLVVDTNGTVLTSNRRFAELFGARPEDVRTGTPSSELAFIVDAVRDPAAYWAGLRDIRDRPQDEGLDTFELKDGRVLERYSRPLVIEARSAGRCWSYRDITERKRAEERLRESEVRFRLIAENVGDLVAMLDPQGRRLYNSPSYGTLFSPDDIQLGSDSFREIHPDDRERVKRIFEQTVSTGVGQRTEFRFLLKDGSVRHIESEGRVICDTSGKVSKVVVVSRDITERKNAQQRESMEHGVTRVLAEAETLAEAIPRIIETICETLGWDCGARWAMDETRKAIHCVETWNIATPAVSNFIDHMRSLAFVPGHLGLVRHVWLSGEPKWIADVSREGGFLRAEKAAKAGLHGAFAFPIRAGSVTLGVLEFFSREVRQPDAPLLQMVRVIGSQIGQFMARKQAEENLLYVATHDTLTGLPNRYLFNQRFAHAINQSQRYRRQLALLFMDLDNFKPINDTLGHTFGDQLLVEVGRRLKKCLRDSDTVARFGGDEFVALIEEFGSPADVASVAQKMLDVISRPFRIERRKCHVTASIGISLFPDDGQNLTTLLNNADTAIYKAKQQGRNSYVFHSDEINPQLLQQTGVEPGAQRSTLAQK